MVYMTMCVTDSSFRTIIIVGMNLHEKVMHCISSSFWCSKLRSRGDQSIQASRQSKGKNGMTLTYIQYSSLEKKREWVCKEGNKHIIV